MKKLPKGVSNYEELVKYNCYYIDKTQYIEKLESLNDRRLLFLRPRRFGKTLFTSILENYYDINKKNKFEELFGETYIGKHPTPLKNKYYIIRFNFSGINTSSYENTINNFKRKTYTAIKEFLDRYNIVDNDNIIDLKYDANDILNDFFRVFKRHKKNEKLYVIIDEYDQFANELLGYNTENFKNLLKENGAVRNWYEILKEGAESIVDRIFITGVAPITLDSLTSGFNIAANITLNEEFNEMLGFTEQELIELMESQEIPKVEQKYILPIMKEYYNGYKFSVEDTSKKIYNSTMCLYFLDYYVLHNRLPRKMTDVNVDSDYTKVSNILNLCKDAERLNIIKQSLADEYAETVLVQKFDPLKPSFDINDMFSMLYYMGYLTIKGADEELDILTIPNKIMKKWYQDYYYNEINKELDNEVTNNSRNIIEEISMYGYSKTTNLKELKF